MKTITPEELAKWSQDYNKEPVYRTLGAACANNEMRDLAYMPQQAARLNGAFSIEVKTHGITAQEKSGRCWMFALLNILREKAAGKMNVEFFELSENYLAFYDKLEKANNVLQMTIDNADKDIYDRKSDYIFSGAWDGGYWDMAADLVRKYGLVPKSAMPESYQSSNTEQFMNAIKPAQSGTENDSTTIK